MTEFDIAGFEEFVSKMSDRTRIYIGGDSRRHKVGGKWHADYATVAVVHIDGCRGCKVFGSMVREPDYDHNGKKPAMRLMMEVYKVAELYEQIKHLLSRFEVEIHLDLNPKKVHNSNQVVQQAIGYIRGTCRVDPKIKPEAFAASYGADHLAQILHYKFHSPHVKMRERTRNRKDRAA